jgi:hypothetical protein
MDRRDSDDEYDPNISDYIISKTCKIRTNCKYINNLVGYFVSCTSIICFLFITN